MAIQVGHTLGPYVIEAAAGAGGMGEVYKAKDTRLDRTVAIKVLPAGTQNNDALRARFEREAKAISSLNHPHICTLHDVGHENGTDFLVMEHLEGEALSDILKSGPLSSDDLFTYGTQIADALDRAHRQGLIHRDLKPANVIITTEGAKLLDFGLAKLQIEQGVVEGISHVTKTTPLTGAGTIIGTIQYMAPEQLEGQEADARSDIFAFGALLYEMATGRSAFSGSSQASLIASILKEEPRPMSELATMTPPALERLVRKCLEKDPNKRWQSASDLRDELRWISQSGSQAGLPIQVSAQRRIRSRLGWTIAAVSTVAAVVLAALYFMQSEPERIVHRFSVASQGNYNSMNWPAISPDGKTLAFLARDTSGTEQIYIRPVRSLDANPLPGTENAGRPWWSPDSRYLAFFVGRQLKKIPVAGGPAQLICEASGADGTWGANGVILFDGNTTDSIRQVSASGGVPTAATIINRDAGETYHAWPWFVPDGNRFLYLSGVDSSTSLTGPYVLKVGSLDGSVDRTIGPLTSRCVFVPGDHILYGQDGLLLIQKIDLDNYAFVDGPKPLAENLASIDANGIFSASESGTLIYQIGEAVSNSRLVWFDRDGKELGTLGDPAPYRDIALSPDETRLAFGIQDARSSSDDIWVMDLARQVSSRLTFEERNEIWPIWSPDGEYIMYASNEQGFFRIVSRRANGLGDISEVYNVGGHVGPSQWLADGRIVASEYVEDIAIRIADLEDSAKSMLIGSKGTTQVSGQISPNGRFIVYESDESGQVEIFVRELSETGGKWQVSSDGGRDPKWRADGKEIFFRRPPDEFYSVAVRTDRGFFEADLPKLLFNRRIAVSSPMQYRYAITSDGQRFLFNEPVEENAETHFVTVLNWDAELEE